METVEVKLGQAIDINQVNQGFINALNYELAVCEHNEAEAYVVVSAVSDLNSTYYLLREKVEEYNRNLAKLSVLADEIRDLLSSSF
jgi:hypothetical protein